MRNDEEFSELAVILAKKVRKIYNDDVYISAVLAEVMYSEEDIQAMIDFIDAGDDVDMETVIVLAIELANAREGL